MVNKKPRLVLETVELNELLLTSENGHQATDEHVGRLFEVS